MTVFPRTREGISHLFFSVVLRTSPFPGLLRGRDGKGVSGGPDQVTENLGAVDVDQQVVLRSRVGGRVFGVQVVVRQHRQTLGGGFEEELVVADETHHLHADVEGELPEHAARRNLPDVPELFDDVGGKAGGGTHDGQSATTTRAQRANPPGPRQDRGTRSPGYRWHSVMRARVPSLMRLYSEAYS